MEFQFSAGGIVFKKEGHKVLVLVAKHSAHHGWVFPKGLIGDKLENEGKEQTAIREVKEETGIDGKILKPLDPVTYWYIFEEVKIKKTVYYFLMKHVGGETSGHDFEMEEVEWIPAKEVEKRLSYPSDRKVWDQAQKLI